MPNALFPEKLALALAAGANSAKRLAMGAGIDNCASNGRFGADRPSNAEADWCEDGRAHRFKD
jgi:hypothetical protein